MLGTQDAVANVAVKDIKAARKFYQDKLGLKPVESEGEDVIVFASGHSKLNVYVSEYAGTNKATTVTWPVEDVDAEVSALKAKGVTFEHYEMPGATLQGDVHVFGEMRAAWFKDPDGNILGIMHG